MYFDRKNEKLNKLKKILNSWKKKLNFAIIGAGKMCVEYSKAINSQKHNLHAIYSRTFIEIHKIFVSALLTSWRTIKSKNAIKVSIS